MAPLLVPLVGALLFLLAPLPSRAGIDPAAAALRNVNAAKRNLQRERRDVKKAEREVAKVKRDPEADREDLREARAELKQERKELKAAAVAYKNAEERYQAFNQGAVSDPDLYETVVALTTPPPEQAAEPPPTSSSLPELGEGREMTEADLGESAALESGPASPGLKGRETRAGALAAAGPRTSAGGSDFGGFASTLDNGALAAPPAHNTQDDARPLIASASGAAGRPAGPHRALEGGRRGEAPSAAGQDPRLDPVAAAKHLAKSQDLARRGAWAEAEREAMEAVRLDPQSGAAHRALAWSQLHLGKFKEAEQAATRALAIDPRDAEAYALRAFALEHQGKREAMLADLRRAALLDPRRFKRLLERAEKGLGVFDPKDKESWRLLEGVSEAPAGRRGWGGAAAGAAALIAVALLALRRRKSPGPAPAPDLAAGAERGGLLAGKYRLKGLVAGSNEIWEALDISLGRCAALKKVELPEGSDAAPRREAALQQAQTLAGLRHPNIVDIYEVLDSPAGLYLAFENLQGKTLRQMLDEERRLPWVRLKAVLAPVCAALEFAHERGVAHRDLKASSVMVSAEGGVKIVDFAVAGALAEGGRAADVRALGALAYEALSGERPLSPGPGSAERAYLRLRELAPEMPEEAAREVAAVFETDAAKRPQSESAFRLAG